MKLRAIACWVAMLGVLLLISACGNENAGSTAADDAHQAAGHEQTERAVDPPATEPGNQEKSIDADLPEDPPPAKSDPADPADQGQSVDPQLPASSNNKKEADGEADHKAAGNHPKPIDDQKSWADQGSGISAAKTDSTGKPAGSGTKNDSPKPEPAKPAPSKAGGTGHAKLSPPAEPSKTGSAGGDKSGGASAKADEQKSAKTNVVEITDFTFSPAKLEIAVGDRITFVNKDPVSHTATADDDSFDTDLFGKDEEKTILFEQEGEFGYYCAPHPAMRGTITVKAK